MKFLKYILFFFAAFTMSSCLEGGLDDLPAYEDADINQVKLEHRWMQQDGEMSQKLRVKYMDLTVNINKENCTINCDVTVPDATKDTGDYTPAVRETVSAENLAVTFTISTAAKMKPLNGAPVPGTPGNFSAGKTYEYEVTAADGKTKKVWKLIIDSFNK